jgi:hypothetical protein
MAIGRLWLQLSAVVGLAIANGATSKTTNSTLSPGAGWQQLTPQQ